MKRHKCSTIDRQCKLLENPPVPPSCAFALPDGVSWETYQALGASPERDGPFWPCGGASPFPLSGTFSGGIPQDFYQCFPQAPQIAEPTFPQYSLPPTGGLAWDDCPFEYSPLSDTRGDHPILAAAVIPCPARSPAAAVPRGGWDREDEHPAAGPAPQPQAAQAGPGPEETPRPTPEPEEAGPAGLRVDPAPAAQPETSPRPEAETAEPGDRREEIVPPAGEETEGAKPVEDGIPQSQDTPVEEVPPGEEDPTLPRGERDSASPEDRGERAPAGFACPDPSLTPEAPPYGAPPQAAHGAEVVLGDASGCQGQTSGCQGQTSSYSGQASGYSGQASGYSGQASGYSGQASGYSGQASGCQGQISGCQGQTSVCPWQTSGCQGQPGGYELAPGSYDLFITSLDGPLPLLPQDLLSPSGQIPEISLPPISPCSPTACGPLSRTEKNGRMEELPLDPRRSSFLDCRTGPEPSPVLCGSSMAGNGGIAIDLGPAVPVTFSPTAAPQL